MKTSKLLVGLAFVGMTAAACSVKTKTTGSSGVGGDVGGATVTTVGVGPTSTTTATTSTATGGSGCDDGTMGDSGSGRRLAAKRASCHESDRRGKMRALRLARHALAIA